MPEQPYIFVSHSHEDNDWCRIFVRAIRKKGANVWWDEDSRDNQKFKRQIEKELRARPIFIVVYSPASLESRWVDREIDAALRLHDLNPDKYRIIQVIAKTCVPPLLLSGYDNVNGLSEAGITPLEAARRISLKLGLPASKSKNRPVLVSPMSSAKDFWERGNLLLVQSRYLEALDAFDAAIQMDPHQPQYWNDKGTALSMLRRYEEAKDAFIQAGAMSTRDQR